MAKKFMYVCFGVMALMATFHLGARLGRADCIVYHNTAGVVSLSGRQIVLLSDGTVWQWGGVWSEMTEYAIPIPVEQVKFWCLGTFVSMDNELWELTEDGWVNHGPPPGSAMTQPTTWGKIKAKWQENE